jgi:hypothetical protein
MFPFGDLLRPFVYFDIQLDTKQKTSIMAFYKRCVQNHLYVFGREKHFLSKNPFFSGMIQSLTKTFPDAKFLCMVRTPFETVPSAISMWSTCFHFFLSPLDPLPLLDAQREIITHYYRYPLEQLAALSPELQQVVTYPALVTEPAWTTIDIYKNFNLAMTPAFMLTLQREEEKARRYASSHWSSLASAVISCCRTMQISLTVSDLTKRDKEKSRLPKAWRRSLEKLFFICSGDTEMQDALRAYHIIGGSADWLKKFPAHGMT